MDNLMQDKLIGCLVGGAIGDSVGSLYESKTNVMFIDFEASFGITDDTQLTLATCESIIEAKSISPKNISMKFLEWFNRGKLTGLGSSTLKALRDLQVGAHWGLSGRSGEYAAGNGAAMRIAPLAFFLSLSDHRTVIRDVCYITHKNEEAYIGALSVLYAIKANLSTKRSDEYSLLDFIIPNLPDTLVKDNMLKLQGTPFLSISQAADLIGCSGHVVESVPLAIFSAQQIRKSNFKSIISEIIRCGGDTDTNASIAGQIMGSYIGYSEMSDDVMDSFNKINERDYILQIAEKLSMTSV
jgi:ADP-ribosyl-[dinitrogen reductase] hydrolase